MKMQSDYEDITIRNHAVIGETIAKNAKTAKYSRRKSERYKI